MAFPPVLDEFRPRIADILKHIRRLNPRCFYVPILQLISDDESVNVDNSLKSLALLGEFFKPDEVFPLAPPQLLPFFSYLFL